MMLVQDSKLTTENEILDRMQSIRRQRETLCEPRVRTEHHAAFQKRQSKIAKLTEREDALRIKLRAIRKG